MQKKTDPEPNQLKKTLTISFHLFNKTCNTWVVRVNIIFYSLSGNLAWLYPGCGLMPSAIAMKLRKKVMPFTFPLLSPKKTHSHRMVYILFNFRFLSFFSGLINTGNKKRLNHMIHWCQMSRIGVLLVCYWCWLAINFPSDSEKPLIKKTIVKYRFLRLFIVVYNVVCCCFEFMQI